MLVVLLPYCLALIYAAAHATGLLSGAFTLDHLTAILTEGRFLPSMLYGAAVAGVSMLLSIAGALYLVVYKTEQLQRGWVKILLYLPLCMPGVVVSFYLLQWLSKSGFLSRVSHAIGWTANSQDFANLVNDGWAIGVILAFVLVVLPFFVLLFRGIYDTERIAQLEQVAVSLGANPRVAKWQISIKILLAKSAQLIGLYFIFLLGAYEIPLLLGQSDPQMPSVLVMRELQQYDVTKISEGYAVATLYTVTVSILALAILLRRRKHHYA